MPFEKRVILEPDDVVIIDMMTKVLVAYVLVGAIRRTTKPGHEAPEHGVVAGFPEYQVVAAFVNQVRRNKHAVREGQSRDPVQNPAGSEQSRETQRVQGDRVDDGKAIPAHSEGVFYEALC